MVNRYALFAFAFVFVMASLVSAGSGSIWTTTNNCSSDSPQDSNHYMVGDVVYISGDNFDSGTYVWDITGVPANKNTPVANGSITLSNEDSFCIEAYTITSNDLGEYKASVGKKHDNFRVDQTPIVPEFGVIAGLTTIAGAVAALLIIRKH